MDNKFADGFYYKAKNENAPEWIDGRIVINVGDFLEWFQQWERENPDTPWLSFDLKTSKEGKKYAQINDYQKVGMTENPVKEDRGVESLDDSEIPF